ncbi:MAG TPA: alkaline phosphatase family protein [Candidatus Cybelea sp.]
MRTRVVCAIAAAVALAGCGGGAAQSTVPIVSQAGASANAQNAAQTPIKHVVVLLQENRTFDNIFHGYPGAHWAKYGINHFNKRVRLPELPLITPWDPAHVYEAWLIEYNGGKMNGFDLETVDQGHKPPKDFAYGYVRHKDVRVYWDLAREGVLGDETFADHRSQTYAGHLYPIAGAAGPIDPADPDWYVANNPIVGTSCADKGYGEAIDIMTGATNKAYRTCFDFLTIGEVLSLHGVSWRYYVPTVERTSIVSGYASIARVFFSKEWSNVASPETTIFSDLRNGTLPSVSWVIPAFANSDHPGQTVPQRNGPNWIANVVNAIGESRYWNDTAIIFTYDDWGGWFDDVKPRTFNYYEAGFRLPLVILSPYARRGYVSHHVHYTGSILHFIEYVYALGSLGKSDARSDRFDDCFDFRQKPLQYMPVTPPGSFGDMLQASHSRPPAPSLFD